MFASGSFTCDESVEGVSCIEDEYSEQNWGTASDVAPLQSTSSELKGLNSAQSQQFRASPSPIATEKLKSLNSAQSQRFQSPSGSFAETLQQLRSLRNAAFKGPGKLIQINTTLDKVDILFVVDTSGSMSEELKSIAHQFDPFLEKIKDLDYHIAILGANGKGGDFNVFQNGQVFLSNPSRRSSTHDENVKQFQQRIQSVQGGGEQGIAAASMALGKRKQFDFFRPHSFLILIVLSDEEENPLLPHGRPEAFFEKVSVEHPYSVVVVNSIVYKPGDTKTDCPTGATHGHNYLKASKPGKDILEEYGNVLEGHVGSICATNYSSQLGPIADLVADNRLIPVPCRPFKDSVSVGVNGREVDFRIKGRKILIKDRVPFRAKVDISLRCDK